MPTYPEIQLYINGQWLSGEGEPVINPADETAIGTVPHATPEQLRAVVEAASEGQQTWSRTAPAKRAKVIMEAAAIFRERSEEVAVAVTMEQGKPIAQSRLEVLRGCDTMEWDAAEGRRMYGRVIPGEPNMRHTVLRQPIGVVAAFTPWNFPISSAARKIGGALAAGCAIILKASEETPAGAAQLVRAFHDAGVPKGVLNLVFGVPSTISEYLIRQPAVRMVTLTGSVPVGKQVAEVAARHMKPCVMELGGHAPVIVCDDTDPVKAAIASVTSKSRNAGQVCVSPTRFFVHEKNYASFVDTFVDKARDLRTGNGLDADTQMGPVANQRRVEAMDALVADARNAGAKVMTGGNRIGNQGYFYPLTVLAEVPEAARVMNEEPFGPIAIINPVKSLDEAIAQANRVPYGLAAYGFTNSARNAAELGERLEAGNISINHLTASLPETPFGGVKDSGYGREGGSEGIECYTTVKNVSHLVV